jgi:hypothetical protein
LSSFTRTTRRNWQTLAGELHKTILIKSDGTIKALIAAAAEDTASTMSRWQTVKTVILDHTPSTTLCSELLRPDGSGQSTTQPILQSVERLIVTPKYMRSTHVHSSQSGPADVDAHTIHSLPTLFNIPTQLCFDSNILSATPLEVYGRYGARPWQLYFQDTPMLPSRPRNVSIHGLSTQLYLCPPDDKLTVHISFDDLLKHDCVVATPGPAHTCLVHNTSHVLIKSFSLECHHNLGLGQVVSYQLISDSQSNEGVLNIQTADTTIKLQGLSNTALKMICAEMQSEFEYQRMVWGYPDKVAAGLTHTVKLIGAEQGDDCSICQQC